MNIKVAYQPDSHIVTAEIEGDITNENVKKAVASIRETGEANDCNYTLMDIRKCREAQPLISGFQGMKDMNSFLGTTYKQVIAVVYDPKYYPSERAQFIENVVHNRPNPPFKITEDWDEAFEWLQNYQKTK